MNNPIVIDLVLVAVIILFCFIGYKRGLMLSIFSTGSSIISFILSILLYPIISKVLVKTPIYDKIFSSVKGYVSNLVGGLADKTAQNAVETMNLPSIIKQNVQEQISQGGQGALSDVVNSLSSMFTNLLIDVIAIFVLFIVVRIVMFLLRNILAGIGQLPLIKQVDKIGGVAFGILEVFILITIVAAVFSYFSSNMESTEFIDALNDSKIGGFFYNNNLILNIISERSLNFTNIK